MNKPKIITNDVNKAINSNKLYSRNQMSLLTKFNRFGFFNNHTYLGSTREYIFFTKPDLHIYSGGRILNKQIGNDPFFIEMNNKYHDVIRDLQKSYTNTSPCPFIPLLTNMARSNMELPNISMDTSESASNIYGTSITYIRGTEESDEKHQFSIEFDDTENLEVYNFLKTWCMYERKKNLGLVSPPSVKYIENKELHDQVSAYKIIVGEDGESIIYMAKAVGVFPKEVPRDVFSSLDKDGGLRYSVPFYAEFVIDDPLIINDFNDNVSSYKNSFSNDIPFYDESINQINGEWCSVPYIYKARGNFNLKNNVFKHDKLRWR